MPDDHVELPPRQQDAIHRALLTGLLANIGTHAQGSEYSGVRGKKFHLFPGSSLFRRKPPWVMSAELVETTRAKTQLTFYDARIPQRIYTAREFESWRRSAEQHNPGLLFTTRGDLMLHPALGVTQDLYPDSGGNTNSFPPGIASKASMTLPSSNIAGCSRSCGSRFSLKS